MNEKSDQELLRAYASEKSEAAFAELVHRHIHLVYSAALRLVVDPHLAEDVAQGTFITLAQNARKLSAREVLSSWLHLTTRNLAAKLVRSEERRRARETEAMRSEAECTEPEQLWRELAPFLDQAIGLLSDKERDVLMLRFFERKSAAEMAQVLSISVEAAQKRVNRAVGRLRELLGKSGVAVSVGALVAALSANAVQAAPAGLASTLSITALSGATITTFANMTAAKALAMTALQKALVAASLLATISVAVYEARQASTLRTELQTQQSDLAEQIAHFRADNENLSSQLARANSSPALTTQRLRELLRLRGEVGVLRRRQGELEKLVAAAQPKGAQLTGHPPSTLVMQPSEPAPFQLRPVLDEPNENTEPMTNTASGTGGETLYVQKTALLDHTAIRSATARTNPSSGAPEIDVEFSDEGKELFAAVTKENINKRLGIVLNGQLYSAPVIRSEISGGKAVITGRFTEAEAKELAARINDALGGP